MSFNKNAEAEILANLGILTNQHLSREGSHRDSITDIKETSNRTRLLSSSDNDKSSLNFDSDDDGVVVFNNSNSLTTDYSKKIIKMSNWQSYLVVLPIILFMSYLIGIFHSLPEGYQNELYKFSSTSFFGIGIGIYTSKKLFETYNPIKLILASTSLAYIFLVVGTILTGFTQYIAVIIFLIQLFYFIKASLLILISTSTETRTFFLLYFFIALGGLIAPISMSKSSFYVTNVEIKTPHLITKKDIQVNMEINTTIKSTDSINTLKSISDDDFQSTTTYTNLNQSTKISKPDSVVGVSENQDKKTEENALQRAAAEEKRKKNESETQSSFISMKSTTNTEVKSTGDVHSTPTTTPFTTNSIKETNATTKLTNKEVEELETTTITTKESKTTKSTEDLLLQKTTEKVIEMTTQKTKIIEGPYSVRQDFIIDKTYLLENLFLVLLLSIIPSLFFVILDLLKIKKLPNDIVLKFVESKTYSSLPLKGVILSYIIWLLLSIIECTFAYCQINKLVKNKNENLFLPMLPIFSLLFIRFIGIFYCKKLVTKRMIHFVQIISIFCVGGTLFIISNYKNSKIDSQMNVQYLNGILGLFIGSISPVYFNWISKMVQKQTTSLLNHFIITYLGSILIAKVLFTYLLKNIDEGKVENSLYIILMLLIILEITFAFLSLHLSSYYRQTEIARLTNSLSGNSRKQNGDVSVKIKKNKYGYNRLVNETEHNFDSLSLIVSDSDSNDEIFS
uniref:UNC93-like protein n=1 Tax=Strongyloides venezuelensis TaxID=75913 RepID=A0A0K0FBT1_STRVS